MDRYLFFRIIVINLIKKWRLFNSPNIFTFCNTNVMKKKNPKQIASCS